MIRCSWLHKKKEDECETDENISIIVKLMKTFRQSIVTGLDKIMFLKVKTYQ